MTRSIAKKFFLALIISLLLPLTSQATSVYWDLGTDYNGNGLTTTGNFNSMTYMAQTSSYQFDDNFNGNIEVGETFLDKGNAQITDFIDGHNGSILDKNGFKRYTTGYEVTLAWDNLAGYISSITETSTSANTETVYTSGTIEMWVDTAFPYDSNFNGTLTAEDDTGFKNGTKIAEITVTSGHGYVDYTFPPLDIDKAGFSLLGEFTMLADDFWYDSLGFDLYDSVEFSMGWLVASTGGDTSNDPLDPSFEVIVNTTGEKINGVEYAFVTNADHDASLSFGKVPEPGTILLLGMGLFGLGIVGVRRKKS